MEKLLDELHSTSNTTPKEVAQKALDHLSDAAAFFARVKKIGVQNKCRPLLFKILSFASEGDSPKFSIERDEQFAQSPSWGSPSSRIEAAEGLMDLLCWRQDDFEKIRPSLDRLALDKVASVRFQIANRLPYLINNHPDWVKKYIRYYLIEEKNASVVGVAFGSLAKTAHADLDDAFYLDKKVYNRFKEPEHEGEERCKDNAVELIADLSIWFQHSDSCVWIEALLETKDTPTSISNILIVRYRNTIVVGDPVNIEDRNEDARKSALELYRKITFKSLNFALDFWSSIKNKSEHEIPETDHQISNLHSMFKCNTRP